VNDQKKLNTFLNEQKYMTIAVVLDDGTPWATPIRIKEWKGRSFQWDSKLDSQHSKAIAARPHIAINIWTPETETTVQFGFYAKATAELIGQQGDSGRYRATVTASWINDASFLKRSVELTD
jgi:pyridoxine/pyridoxamine 5'-phosphate oxidase